MISIQSDKIATSMSFDKKDMFQRLTKLLEEQGELNEAILESDVDNIIEESVDNLLVIASIGYLVDKNSMSVIESVVNETFEKSITLPKPKTEQPKFVAICMDAMIYNVCIGQMSDMIQKYLKVGASKYKGEVTQSDTFESVLASIRAVVNIMTAVFDEKEIETAMKIVNELILMKNQKWLEKSIEGNK